MTISYFAPRTAAERYVKGRPYVHPAIAARVMQMLGVQHLRRVLDVGCGTGQSTRAIAEYADEAVGVDNAEEMLHCAEPAPNVEYRLGSAEALPVGDAQFELLTAGLAFHWFDQERFLVEASRVLEPHGWLAIYNSGFTGKLPEVTDFEAWFRGSYLNRYPAPARNRHVLDPAQYVAWGFELIASSPLETKVSMDQEQFISFLLTQSNVISAVEFGKETIDQAAAWIADSVQPAFREQARQVPFSVDIRILRRTR